jgi:hypothetical protein
MQTNNYKYQNFYGELKSSDLIEFVTPVELTSLFELIAPQFNASCTLKYNRDRKPLILFKLNKEYRIIIKSIDGRWSDNMQSDKFVLLAPICKQGSLTCDNVNTLNRENVDIKFTLYKPKGDNEPYLGIDKLMSLTGGVTVQSIIMLINEFIFSQKTLHLALKHNSDKPAKTQGQLH